MINGHSSGRVLILFFVLIFAFSLLLSSYYSFKAYAQVEVEPLEAYYVDWENAETPPGHPTVYGPARLAVDANDKIWFTAAGRTIGKLDPVTGQIERHVHHCSRDSYQWDPTVIGIDKHTGLVWFGTFATIGQLAKYDPSTDSFSCINLPEKLGLVDLVVDNVGYVWMAARATYGFTLSEIIKYDYRTGQFSEYPMPEFVQFSELFVDKEGAVWINDGYTSIWRLDRTTRNFTRHNVGHARHGLTQDDVGNFWFGYSASKIGKLNPSTDEVSTFNMPEGTEPRAFMKNDKGDIFFAGKNKMIHRLTPATNGIIDYEMVVGWQGNDIVMDGGGDLWFTEGNSLVNLNRALARGATTSQTVPVKYKKTINNAQGGKITTDFSDAINFDPGSLAVASAELTMTMDEPPDPQEVGHQPIPRAFKFGPAGETFDPSANNKVSYGVGVDLEAIDPANVGVYYWDSATSTWVYQDSTNDVEKKTLSFPVSHFSEYALFAPKVHFAWQDPLSEDYNYPLANGDTLLINFKLEREDGEPVAQEHLKVKVTMPMDPRFPERRTIKEFAINDGLSYEGGIYQASLDTSSLTHEDGTRWTLPNGEFYKAEVFYAGLKKSEAEFSLLDPATGAIVYTVASVSPEANEKGWHHQDVKVNLKGYYLTLDEADQGRIKEIHYLLDGNNEVVHEGEEVEVSIAEEGEQTLTYWAVDTQGREEAVKKELKIKIDKTPPEAVFVFDPEYQSFKVEVKEDNLSGEGMIRPTGIEQIHPHDKAQAQGKGKSCSSRQIISYTLSDAAGNSLVIPIDIKTTKTKLKAALEKLVYNGEEKPLPNNSFHFTWVPDETGGFRKLHQDLDVKNKIHLIGDYDSGEGETIVKVLKPGEKTQITTESGMKILKLELKNSQLEHLP